MRLRLIGWGLGGYRFRRYKTPLREPAMLAIDGDADAETLDVLDACLKVRDLVNTPTEDMGPDELEAEVTQLSLALNQKVAEEASAEEQAANASLPKGFPLSSSASYKSTLDDPNADASGKASSSSKTGNPILVFTASAGSQVVASGDGTVVTVTADAKYGNCVTIDHGNGYVSVYRNKGDSLVKAKDKVSRGDPLFVVGKSNTSLGYQIEYNDEFIDPESMIEING